MRAYSGRTGTEEKKVAMQTGYFSAAWRDVRNSSGWLAKVAVLALVGLVPVFGQIVAYGYLFGWARDIAWGVHAPLPSRIFGNEDGALYRRGFFAFVIALVCSLVPWALGMVWGVLTGIGAFWSARGGFAVALGPTMLMLWLLFAAAVVLSLLFFWVGTMRMSIYGRLAPGFQLGRIWAMMRHDFGGLLRILGMAAFLTVATGVVVWAATLAITLAGALVGVVIGTPMVSTNNPVVLLATVPGLVALVTALVVLCAAFSTAAWAFATALIARALGYWTRQFDVPSWCGQDDPMPFEMAGGPRPTQVPPSKRG